MIRKKTYERKINNEKWTIIRQYLAPLHLEININEDFSTQHNYDLIKSILFNHNPKLVHIFEELEFIFPTLFDEYENYLNIGKKYIIPNKDHRKLATHSNYIEIETDFRVDIKKIYQLLPPKTSKITYSVVGIVILIEYLRYIGATYISRLHIRPQSHPTISAGNVRVSNDGVIASYTNQKKCNSVEGLIVKFIKINRFQTKLWNSNQPTIHNIPTECQNAATLVALHLSFIAAVEQSSHEYFGYIASK